MRHVERRVDPTLELYVSSTTTPPSSPPRSSVDLSGRGIKFHFVPTSATRLKLVERRRPARGPHGNRGRVPETPVIASTPARRRWRCCS
jgi:hypothetical protein